MDDADLNAIRAARLAELQKSSSAAPSALEERTGTLLSQILEPSARERLSRVRIVRPDRAEQVEQYLVKMASSGALTRKVGEKDVVDILDSFSRGEKKQTKIVFDRKETEDDDDDDFFD